MVGFALVGPLVEALGAQTVYGLGAVLSVIAALTFAIPTGRSSEVAVVAEEPAGQ